MNIILKNPLLSIIVPIFNQEKYLNDCLNSIANQSFKDFEVILVNDGSTDNSRNICQEFCNDHPNFHLLDKENGGQMSAWILGVKNARGKLIGFVDSDDLVDEKMYEHMVFLQQKYNSDLVMCDKVCFYDDETIIPDDKSDFCVIFYDGDEYSRFKRKFFPDLLGGLSISRWDKIYKKDILMNCVDKYCKETVRTYEDRFIVIPYIMYAQSFVSTSKKLYYYRQLKNSSSQKTRKELCSISNLLFNTHKQLIRDLDVFDEYIPFVEMEKIDVLRSIFVRNVCVKVPRKELISRAKEILSKENRLIVLSHKKECVGKFGKFFYLCCKFNSPSMLVFGGKIFRKIRG